MKNNKGLKRREFIKLFSAGALTVFSGCYSANYQYLGKDCYVPEKNKKEIRVMSFNIANARGNNDIFFSIKSIDTIKYNLDWIVKLIRHYDIDVCCFNEVDFNSVRTYNINMAKYIADALCYNHVIEERIFDTPSILEVGNAVVSRYPLRLNSHQQYGKNFSDRITHIFKSFVDFDVLLDDSGHKLNMVLTHLDHSSEKTRCKEFDILRSHLEGKQDPFAVLGDFNSTLYDECFKWLLENGLVGNPYLGIHTYPSDAPFRAIDNILVSQGLNIENYHTVSMQPSDHLPIIGDISFVEI